MQVKLWPCHFFSLWLLPFWCIGLITTIQLLLPPFYPEMYKRIDSSHLNVSAEFLQPFGFEFSLALAMSRIVYLRILSVDPNF